MSETSSIFDWFLPENFTGFENRRIYKGRPNILLTQVNRHGKNGEYEKTDVLAGFSTAYYNLTLRH